MGKHCGPRLAGRVAGEQRDPPRGGGGNRTRVLQYLTRASPSASCIAFLGPGSPAGKLPTGSVAVRCPDQSRDRAGRWILLADARHRVGGIPGLTNLLLCGYLGRESEVSALNLGTYEVCGHSINEVMSAVLGSLPLDQPLKSKPVTPCWVVVLPDATGSNAEQPSRIPRGPRERKMPDGLPAKRAHRAPHMVMRHPRGRWRWPKCAHGGRPAGSGPVFIPGPPPR
jgi:hypothetical protein